MGPKSSTRRRMYYEQRKGMQDRHSKGQKKNKTKTANKNTKTRIQQNPKDPTFYTNRALTRLRLSKHNPAEQDAQAAVTLYGPDNPTRLKSSYYLAQALLGQDKTTAAHDVALAAYKASLAAKSPQTENLSRTVLRAKQQVWAARETRRLREREQTLAVVEGLLESEAERARTELQRRLQAGEVGEIGFLEDEKALREDVDRNISHVREAFRVASSGEVAERIVPDYLVDGISFEIMHDPVITPSGSSFDRVGIVKYVEQAGVDPLTRVKMSVADLRPNYALKAACEEFLENNGWAVDW